MKKIILILALSLLASGCTYDYQADIEYNQARVKAEAEMIKTCKEAGVGFQYNGAGNIYCK